MAILRYPIYETYEKHQRAQKRDRIKHYPGGRYTTEQTDTATWRVSKRHWPSKMSDFSPRTTADYVEAFCVYNELKR